MDKLLKRVSGCEGNSLQLFSVVGLQLLPGVDLNEELNKSTRNLNEDSSGEPVSRSEEREVLGKLSKLTLKPHSHRFFGKSRYRVIPLTIEFISNCLTTVNMS